jgi:hypothetical protein
MLITMSRCSSAWHALQPAKALPGPKEEEVAAGMLAVSGRNGAPTASKGYKRLSTVITMGNLASLELLHGTRPRLVSLYGEFLN